MNRVLLVRHGQSEWNVHGRWQGQADPPLSPVGHEQAARAGAALRALPEARAITGVACSDLQRALSTAAALAAALGLGAPEPVVALRERAIGAWQGLTRAEIAARHPGSPEGPYRPPGWEGDDALLARIVPALAALRRRGTFLVVGHEGLIRTLEGGGPFPNLHGRWFTGEPPRPDGPRLPLPS